MTHSHIETLTATLQDKDLVSINDGSITPDQFQKWLGQQDLSADTKVWISKIAQTTITVGTQIIKIGLKVVTTCLNAIKAYPNTAFGIVVSAVLSFLVGSIPLIGAIIGPFMAPLFLAFGVGMGAIADFQSSAFRARMDAMEAEYSALRS